LQHRLSSVILNASGTLGRADSAAEGCRICGLERCQAAFFQEDQALEVVAGGLELQDERSAHDSETAHQFATYLG